MTFNKVKGTQKNYIYVHSEREFEIFVLLLGNDFLIDFENLPQVILRELNEKNYDQIRKAIANSKISNLAILNYLEKIVLKISTDKYTSIKINKGLFRNHDSRAILVKKGWQISNTSLYVFQSNLEKLSEADLDYFHYPNVEMSALSKVCRQSVLMAISNRENINGYHLFLVDDYKHFYSSIQNNDSVTINVFEMKRGNDDMVSLFTVIQNDQLKMSGYTIDYQMTIEKENLE